MNSIRFYEVACAALSLGTAENQAYITRCLIMSACLLRLPESLKLAAKRIAAQDDTTMNQFFVVAIAEKISTMETAKFFESRGALANPQAADAAWAKVARSTSPVAGDAWSA